MPGVAAPTRGVVSRDARAGWTSPAPRACSRRQSENPPPPSACIPSVSTRHLWSSKLDDSLHNCLEGLARVPLRSCASNNPRNHRRVLDRLATGSYTQLCLGLIQQPCKRPFAYLRTQSVFKFGLETRECILDATWPILASRTNEAQKIAVLCGISVPSALVAIPNHIDRSTETPENQEWPVQVALAQTRNHRNPEALEVMSGSRRETEDSSPVILPFDKNDYARKETLVHPRGHDRLKPGPQRARCELVSLSLTSFPQRTRYIVQ